jgi:hypothetical protein
VIEAPKFLSITLTDGGRSLSIAPGDNIPWGISQGYIKLQTNSDVQPEVWIHYQLDMHGVVVPSQNPVEFSSDSVGGEQEETVRLMRNDGKPVRVESMTASGVSFKTRIDECAPVAADCKLLRIALPADAPSGLIAGAVTLKFEGLGNELPIVVGGFRLAKGQRLKSLSDDTSTQTSKSIKAQPPLDINQAIERTKRRAEQPVAPPGNGPLLKWSVAHEGAIYGYLIYRGDTEAGEFVRINKETIRVQNDGDEGSSYQWRDNSAVSGKTYWYYIGIVNNNGSKKNLSSPQKVVAK